MAPLTPLPKTCLSLSFSLAEKIIYQDAQLKGEASDLLLTLPGCSIFPPDDEHFLIVNITPTSKRQFKERISLCLSIQKLPCFSLPFGQEQNILGNSFERRTNQFVLKATMVFPIPTRQSRKRNVNT